MQPQVLTDSSMTCVLPSLSHLNDSKLYMSSLGISGELSGGTVLASWLAVILYDYPGAPRVTLLSGCNSSSSLQAGLTLTCCQPNATIVLSGYNLNLKHRGGAGLHLAGSKSAAVHRPCLDLVLLACDLAVHWLCHSEPRLRRRQQRGCGGAGRSSACASADRDGLHRLVVAATSAAQREREHERGQRPAVGRAA